MRWAAAFLALASCIGCGGGSPPVPTSPTSTAPNPSPAVQPSLLWFCCGSSQVPLGSSRQLEARATWPDGSITDITAEVSAWKSSNESVIRISDSGMATGVAPGTVVASFTYLGKQATSELYAPENYFRPPAANEVTGYVRERTAFGDIDVWSADVTYESRHTVATLGFFRLAGLDQPGGELVVRRAGYETERVRVGALGQHMGAIYLEPDPSMISDTMEGDVCWPTRSVSKVFTPSSSGPLRITNHWFLSTSRELYENGARIRSFLPNNADVPLSGGATYELKLTGSCDYNPSTRARITFLRPR